eukprot:COSAG01_NODE_6564_length_3607_cov_1.225200_1_plen_793_part_10
MLSRRCMGLTTAMLSQVLVLLLSGWVATTVTAQQATSSGSGVAMGQSPNHGAIGPNHFLCGSGGPPQITRPKPPPTQLPAAKVPVCTCANGKAVQGNGCTQGAKGEEKIELCASCIAGFHRHSRRNTFALNKMSSSLSDPLTVTCIKPPTGCAVGLTVDSATMKCVRKLSVPCPPGQFFNKSIDQAGAGGVCAPCPPTGCGCKDPQATNFDASAQHADSTCIYTSLCSKPDWTCYAGTCRTSRSARAICVGTNPPIEVQVPGNCNATWIQQSMLFSVAATKLDNFTLAASYGGKRRMFDPYIETPTERRLTLRGGKTLITMKLFFPDIGRSTKVSQGGAINANGGTIVMSYTSFVGTVRLDWLSSPNTKGFHHGGAIYAVATNVSMTHTSFERLKASAGGAIYAQSQVATSKRFLNGPDSNFGAEVRIAMSYTSFKRNEASYAGFDYKQLGGAIYLSGGFLTVLHTLFEDNTAWSSGGAIYLSGGSVEMTYASFKQNAASGTGSTSCGYRFTSGVTTDSAIPFGDHIFATSHVSKVKIVTTTFTPIVAWSIKPGKSVSLGGAPAGCEEYPCAAGQECIYRNYSLSCASCATGLVGLDGLRCTQCLPGQQPNLDRTQCVKCIGATYSQFGVQCVSCTDVVDDNHLMCTKCTAGKQPMTNRSGCVPCAGATYSQFGARCLPCGQVIDSGRTSCTPCLAGSGPNAQRTHCQPCVGANYSISGTCMECPQPNVVDSTKTRCSKCDPGKQPVTNRSACVPCAGATYSQFGARCLPCDKVIDALHTMCTSCAAGKGPNT